MKNVKFNCSIEDIGGDKAILCTYIELWRFFFGIDLCFFGIDIECNIRVFKFRFRLGLFI